MGVMFITHDFGVVAEIADRVAVMQHGRIVEQGAARDVLDRPQHAYTKTLIAAVPRLVGRPAASALAAAEPLFSAQGVRKSYWRRAGLLLRRRVDAVHDADFELRQGETLGLVGESGSGKSTLARCAVRLIEPDAGAVLYRGQDLVPLPRARLRPYRKRIQMIFQDPFASLNPRRRVGDIVAEGPVTHGESRARARERAAELLRLVGLDASAMARYPHEFSGGQRQRIGIARALALEPEILVADEPVSALDVSVQAQVLDLLAAIKRRLGLTMLFITHDLRVAAQICDTIAVMRAGAIVERGPTAQVFSAPAHPYTRELLAAIPGKDWLPAVSEIV
jgi:peptide/nickel transport system ATP-binding protein